MENMNNSNGIVPTMPINNDGFGMGGAGTWIFGLIALALFANGGFGFGNNGSNVATQDYVSSEFTQQAINNGFQNTNNAINNGFQNIGNAINGGLARTNDNLCDVRQAVLTGDMGLNSSILENRYAGQLSACQTQRDILTQTNELNTNLLTTNLQSMSKMDECCCNLRAQGIENTQKILDALNQNTIDSLRSEVNDLKNTITSNSVSNNVINAVRPYPVPSWTVSSPYQSLYNGFYGAGFYGNTIV